MPRSKVSSSTPGVDWITMPFIVSYHLALFVSFPLYITHHTPGWALIAATLLLIGTTLLSITTGYHRLYAHRTYRTKKVVEWVLVFFGTLATQGSVLRWAHDHRLHHSHLDSERDPYGTPEGFWQSHLLWMFEDHGPMDERYLGDLKENRLLVHQHRYYGLWMAVTNIAATLVVAWITGDLFGAIVFAFLLRLFVVHHCTWFINSLAHMWGSKPYSTEHSAVNNFILALLTAGEGYHNYHHTFASDYRNGIRWYQFDPPKYLIWMMSKVGLATDLKKTDPLIIKKRLVQADRKLLMEHLERVRDVDVSDFVAAVERTYDKLSARIASAKTVMDRYRSLERKKDHPEVRELRRRFDELRREIRQDLKAWRELCRVILKMEPGIEPSLAA